MIFDLLDKSWLQHLKEELNQEYIKDLEEFLVSEYKEKEIFPPKSQIFEAFDTTTFYDTRVVIIGQDPYHGENQAHGLAFSVKKNMRIPPSLRNIYKELNNDLGIEVPNHGHLIKWSQQGVLLLNTVLTVQAGKAGSHQKKGWEKFTDKIIEVLNNEKENLVFILWGSPAQKKGKSIDENKHLVLKSVHPSPLSAHRGFFDNHHFSKTNEYLKKNGLREINWNLN